MPPKALIVHPPTAGLRHDRLVLAEALLACDPSVQVHALEVSVAGHHDYETPFDLGSLTALQPFDCTFLLEEARSNPPLFDTRFTKRVAYVPNPEWVLPVDEASLREHPVDVVLLKNGYARHRIEATSPKALLPRAHVVGWTSLDVGNDRALEQPPTKTFLHLAGTSRQKGTSLLVAAWLEVPSLPKLTVARHLLPDPTAFRKPLNLANNVMLHLTGLTRQDVQRMQTEHGIHIYPSLAEGFGHALNEARALGRVLITTDAPPMRDLVTDGVTGALIPIDPANIHSLHLASAYPVTTQALQATASRLLERDSARLHAMGKQARRDFIRDKASFHFEFGRLWRDLR